MAQRSGHGSNPVEFDTITSHTKQGESAIINSKTHRETTASWKSGLIGLRILAAALLFIFVMQPVVQAQTYSQPVLGVSWNRHGISVGVPTSPSWAPPAINTAIDDWNNAQLWFIHTYFPDQTSAQFLLMGNQKSSQSQVAILYVTDLGQYWTGITETPVSGTISNETILVVLSRVQTPKDLLQVTEHELGHVLGLDHTQLSSDLMYAAQDAYTGGEPSHPSTLNLYAIYLLGLGCNFSAGETVTLPSQIPYVEWFPGIQQTTVNAPQTTAPTTGCPSPTPIWRQPSFIFAVAIGSILVVAVVLNSRRKKNPRPSRFMES